MEFQVSIIRDMLYGAAEHGANFHQLCRRAGIDPETLKDAEKMVPWEYSPYLWDHIVEMTGDPLIGLHIGQETRPTAYGMIGYLLQACGTFGEVITAVSGFNNTFSSIFRYTAEIKGDLVYQYMEPMPLWWSKYPVSAQQGADVGKSSALRTFNLLTGQHARPLKALFTCSKNNVEEYRRVLQCELVFNAPRDGMVFPRAVMDAPVLSHDQSLFALFNNLLTEKQQKLASRKTFSEELRLALLTDFKGQAPPIHVAASHLGMNTRTFQRRLAEESSSYRAVCSDLRKELALAILENDKKNINEIALLLGYADHTSFRRAFKSWTGRLPKEAKLK
ncbi:AraC family transcriptional regulator [Chitinophaga sp. GCM10012297]|uniref:AraC family transcriptional regulator n=1 Tax=Chitinophaga chungangae TaxID=2821488 RepID=A0ABS3YKK2_9BACT|nr:AraC family transcriptional regulator [Chitinophaga chungangae]MBO9155219.1 AraC family transcriptional regulator [Chitinophaga chungangae]